MSQDRFSDLRRDLPQHLPALWRYALALSARLDIADDLVQATCVRAIERAEQFRPGTSLIAWLVTICRSIWLNELRSRTIRDHQSLGGDLLDLPDTHPGTEANIFAREVFAKVMQLPEAQRETVVLAYVEGFTYSEVAAALDIPIGTVMSRLSAARAKLRPLAGDGQPERQAGE